MNDSLCVIFTFLCSSPLVFHYNNSLARSDKADDVAIRPDYSPQPERSTLSCSLFFTCRAPGKTMEEQVREKKKQLHMQHVKIVSAKCVRHLSKVIWSVYNDGNFKAIIF